MSNLNLPVGRRSKAVVVALVLAALAGGLWLRHRHAPAPTTDLANAPLVSAVAPGKTAYQVTASFTGAVVARYDMPIGVDGESGRIAAILVEVGDHVRQGQVLARLDTAVLAPQVANLSAALEQARAEAALAEADYRRAAAIADSVGALSKEEVDKRQSQAITSRARVQAASAQLQEAEARLRRTDIVAPAAGLVLTRTAEVGQAVTPGGAVLFRLARDGEVEMRAQVAEQDLPKLQTGQAATIRLTGVPTTFEGHVRLLAAVIDPQTRLGEVRIALKPDPNLRPGAFATGEVVLGSGVKPIIPQTALLSDRNGTYVLLAGDDHRVARRAVTVGPAQSAGVVIADGLDGSERVISIAGAFLRPGELVRVDASPAAP